MREETFGPTLPVMKVRNEEEAIELANDSPYGLGGSVWTSDLERAERISRRLETGAVNVNNAMINAFQFGLPFGGWKQSGIGNRFGGPNGILKFCRNQAFVSERINLKSEMHWYPYTARRGKLQGVLVRLLGAHDWRRRLGRRGRRS
jgi:acyl-CoA reductase-like NAD-dependent aldehyde dehydrogenase